jgi:hypothetical protein
LILHPENLVWNAECSCRMEIPSWCIPIHNSGSCPMAICRINYVEIKGYATSKMFN